MRRLAAHLVLLSVCAGFFSPLLLAEQSVIHACCRRTGAHHCQGSDEAGFHSKTNNCPFSTPLPPGAVFGLEPAKASVTSPAVAGILVHRSSSFYIASPVRDLSARAPPIALA